MKLHIILIALLLISLLSNTTFAERAMSDTTLTPDFAGGNIYFNIRLNSSSLPINQLPTFVYINLTSSFCIEIGLYNYTGSETERVFRSNPFYFSCWNGYRDCEASGYVNIGVGSMCGLSNLSISAEDWSVFGGDELESPSPWQNCTLSRGSSYISLPRIDWSYGNPYAQIMIVNCSSHFISSTPTPLNTTLSSLAYTTYNMYSRACWYVDSNTYLNPSGKYYFNQYANTSCNFCITGTSQCSNYDNQTCVSGSYVTTKSCSAGGWSDCGLSGPDQCQSTPYTYTECTSDANCTSDQVCSCGTGSTGQPWGYYNCSTHPSLQPGVCVQKEGKSCSDDSQCIYNLCLGKSSGQGTCAYKCSSNSDCPSSQACASYTDIPFTNFQYTCGQYMNETCGRGNWYQTNYCVDKLSQFCWSNEECYSGNCKVDCATGVPPGRCIVPSYSCYCNTAPDCGTGQTCIAVDYSGPITNTFGKYVCISGKSNGQTCTANDQCASSNCQNGYCCGAGQVCCSVDGQCPSGQVCFTNTGWLNYNFYYACHNKIPGNNFCTESKECITPPCTPFGGTSLLGYCSGSLIATTWSYTITPSTYTSGKLPLNTEMTMKMNYRDLLGATITASTCTLKRNGTSISTADCSTTFAFNLTRGGINTFMIYAYKSGYETATGSIISINVYDNSTLIWNGQECSSDDECQSGKCAWLFEGIEKGLSLNQICYTDIDCAFTRGEECFGLWSEYIVVNSTNQLCTSDSQCYQWFGNALSKCSHTTGKCVFPGLCNPAGGHQMCCANDANLCCEPGYELDGSKPCGDYKKCSFDTYTCAIRSLNAGNVCNTTDQCISGATCHQTYNSSDKVCCWGPKGSDYCANSAHLCPTGFDYNVGNQAFVCAPLTGGVTPGGQCSSTDQCITDAGYTLVCNAGKCEVPSCNNGEVSCIFCDPGNGTVLQLTPLACRVAGYNRTVGCVSSSIGCIVSGGTSGVTPPSVGGYTDIEDVFFQIVTLMQYVIIAVIFFFILAVFVTGLTVAYGLVKR